MSTSERRQFTAELKAEIVRRHLVDRVPVSDLCDEYKIAPSLLYSWQRVVLEQMAQVLEHGSRRNGKADAAQANRDKQKVASLEAKLARKDEVIAEISADYVRLKKELGES